MVYALTSAESNFHAENIQSIAGSGNTATKCDQTGRTTTSTEQIGTTDCCELLKKAT
jgi:hypothetical protein